MNKIQMRNILARAVLVLMLTMFAAGLLMVILFGAEVRNTYADRIYDSSNVPEAVYGVVLGASIDPESVTPNDFLRDRLDTAIDLLKSRRIMGVIITGDDGKWRSNEIKAMRDYLNAHQVPDDIIHVDAGAYRTYDSCENLREKGFTNVVLITQRFHLSRALYLCNKLGVVSNGVAADKQWYAKAAYHWTRDFLAAPFAYFDVRGLKLIQKGPQD